MIHFPELLGVYDHGIVHCSATPPSMDIGAAWVDRVHRRKGWSMCGYHIVIRRDGSIEWSGNGARTRPIGRAGSHVGGCGPGWNQRSLGICLIGGVKEDGRTPENNFTDAQFAALKQVLGAAVDAFGIPEENVMGHRDLIKLTNAAPKACPCFSVEEFKGNMDFKVYDRSRLSFNWNRKERPAPQRGEKLNVHRVHTVKRGDTLWSISRVTGVPVKDIMRNNNLDTDDIIPGQKLRLIN
jgi:hypothetical protein